MQQPVQEAPSHPRHICNVTVPTVVRIPAFVLIEGLRDLVRAQPTEAPRELVDAFALHGDVAIAPGAQPGRVDNARIPSRWVQRYMLQGRKTQRAFDALVHFGPGFTDDHFETCAAATYGVLLVGEKRWTFRASGGTSLTCTQHAGDTIYVPPGWIHQMETVSNGAIIIGETHIVPASARAFLTRARDIFRRLVDPSALRPVDEAQRLCDHFGIVVSAREQERDGHGLNAPVFRALRRFVSTR
ncbi:hypothetical protein PINS_up007006 [Pythium insidiosum]|nr:hypothetical protein PINS_up007006 [Pythium insidiosum]